MRRQGAWTDKGEQVQECRLAKPQQDKQSMGTGSVQALGFCRDSRLLGCVAGNPAACCSVQSNANQHWRCLRAPSSGLPSQCRQPPPMHPSLAPQACRARQPAAGWLPLRRP